MPITRAYKTSGILGGATTNGETLVADSSTSTGLRYQPTMAAGKNFLINGGFDIWQRATSSATNGGYSTADRFNFDSSNCTKSQQSTGAPNGSRYYLRNAFTGSSAYCTVFQNLETANVAYLWGKTVTFSVKLRRNASMTSNLTLEISKNATVDAGPGTASWSVISAATITNASLPTGTSSADWFTGSLTVTIPNDGTANSLRVYVATSTTQASGAQWEMAQAQLEIGSVATEFSRAGGTLAGELAACQRYYWRVSPAEVYYRYALGYGKSTTAAEVVLFPPVTMRADVTAVESTTIGNYAVYDGTTITALTGFGFSSNSTNTGITMDAQVASGLTAFRPYVLISNNNASTYLGFSAEL